MKCCTFTFFVTILLLAGAATAQQSQRDQGIDLYREGKFDKAIDLLASAAAADKKDRIAWTYLGACYVHTKDYGQAQKAFGNTNIIQKENLPVYDKPFKITNRPRASYTEEGRRNNSSGTIKVEVELKADGKIGFVFPLQNFINDLEPSAIDAAKRIRFEPAIKNGVPVTVVTVFEYSFWIG